MTTQMVTILRWHLLSQKLCGCSFAQKHVFCLLTVSSKWKWASAEDCVLECFSFVFCTCCRLKPSFLLLFLKFMQYRNFVKNGSTSLWRILWIEQQDIPNSCDAFHVHFPGLHCMATQSSSAFSNEHSRCLRSFFFSHITFIFRLAVEMKNRFSCRCPAIVRNNPKSSLDGNNTHSFGKKGNNFISFQSSDGCD